MAPLVSLLFLAIMRLTVVVQGGVQPLTNQNNSVAQVVEGVAVALPQVMLQQTLLMGLETGINLLPVLTVALVVLSPQVHTILAQAVAVEAWEAQAQPAQTPLEEMAVQGFPLTSLAQHFSMVAVAVGLFTPALTRGSVAPVSEGTVARLISLELLPHQPTEAQAAVGVVALKTVATVHPVL